jgi:hypothetical protein
VGKSPNDTVDFPAVPNMMVTVSDPPGRAEVVVTFILGGVVPKLGRGARTIGAIISAA